MSFISIGDQARMFLQSRQYSSLKTSMQRMTEELSSGRLQNPATRTTADTVHLYSITREQTRLAAYRTATAEAKQFIDTAQEVLGTVDEVSNAFGATLVSAGSSVHRTLLDVTAKDAEIKFATIVSTFNTRSADRAVFSGISTGTNPLAPAEDMLADLRTAIAGQTTAAGIESAVNDWFFLPGGGFETLGYLGATTGLVTYRTGDEDDLTVNVRGDDASIRSLLKGFAMAALMTSPDLGGDLDEQGALAQRAGLEILNANSQIATTRAGLGAQQARIEATSVRQAAQKTALEVSELQFTSADPYDTASALQAVQSQLETLYTLTARQAHLSLVEYLR